MSIIPAIFEGIKSISDIVDSLHTSTEEKAAAKFKLAKLNADLSTKVLDHETRALESRAKIVEAEAKSESWLTCNWRPVCALTLLSLAVGDAFGVLANPLAEEAWELLQLCLGGYIVTRGGQKIVKEWKKQ